MKIERLLGIIHILMEKDKITAPELAAHFEVSRRTINRDIDTLLLAGIPIMTTQGFDGGITLDAHYKMDKKLFTMEELQAVISGLKGIDSVSLKSYTKQLKEKLSLEESTYFMEHDHLLISLSSHYKEPLTSKIQILKTAIQQTHNVSFSYFSHHGREERTIEPHLLIFEWSSWYVLGFCQKCSDFRLFKLNRMLDLHMEQTRFTYRPIPEAELNFYEHFSDRYELLAVFDKEVVFRVIDEYGTDFITLLDDGSCRLKKSFSDYRYMKSWVSSFGSHVIVEKPVQLREDLYQEAMKISRFYDRHDI